MKYPITGRCQCGSVVCTLKSPPVITYACYCSACQKRSGTPFSMGMFMPADQIDVQGEVEGWTRTSDQGNQNTRFACSECGNVIYGVSDHKPDVYKFQPGLLDDTSEVEPDIHIWVEQAQKWVLFPEGAPQFKGQPDPADSLKAGLEYQKSRR